MLHWLVAVCVLTSSLAHAAPNGTESAPIAWCQGDRKCLQRSEKVIPLFAKKTNQTEAELRHALNDCESGPSSRLAFCGWYSRFGAEVELKDQLERLVSTSTKACAKRLLFNQRQWEKEQTKRCEMEATRDTGYWGHRQKELLQICLEKANDDRSEKLSSIDKCSPCSLCD